VRSGKLEALFVAGLVEEAHLYRIGNVRRHSEICPTVNRGCSEREIVTSLYIHPLTVPFPSPPYARVHLALVCRPLPAASEQLGGGQSREHLAQEGGVVLVAI
jgi:hypothetical protein